ncbi:unnamed protein product [Choristocarpus tenellus]
MLSTFLEGDDGAREEGGSREPVLSSPRFRDWLPDTSELQRVVPMEEMDADAAKMSFLRDCDLVLRTHAAVVLGKEGVSSALESYGSSPLLTVREEGRMAYDIGGQLVTLLDLGREMAALSVTGEEGLGQENGAGVGGLREVGSPKKTE